MGVSSFLYLFGREISGVIAFVVHMFIHHAFIVTPNGVQTPLGDLRNTIQ